MARMTPLFLCFAAILVLAATNLTGEAGITERREDGITYKLRIRRGKWYITILY